MRRAHAELMAWRRAFEELPAIEIGAFGIEPEVQMGVASVDSRSGGIGAYVTSASTPRARPVVRFSIVQGYDRASRNVAIGKRFEKLERRQSLVAIVERRQIDREAGQRLPPVSAS